MSDKIYNKNAREKALLEEAYSSIYKEKEGEVIEEYLAQAGRLLGSAGLTKAAAKKAAGKVGQGAVSGAAQGAKLGAAQKVQGMISGQPQPAVPIEDEGQPAHSFDERQGRVDVELESWWEYDPHDVMVKVYHGALHQLPPQQGTPAYEANFEKVFSWLEGKYPQQVTDDVRPLGRAAALRKGPGGKDRLFYK